MRKFCIVGQTAANLTENVEYKSTGGPDSISSLGDSDTVF